MREQLATLVDTSNSDPALPTGHPFLNVQSESYWAATTDANASISAFIVNFSGGLASFADKDVDRRAWCARGGQVYDGQDVKDVYDALP